MNSPARLIERLRRQWNATGTRVARLLDPAEDWPITLPIVAPTPREFADQTREVREHRTAWQSVTVGTVIWKEVKYRDAAAPVKMPITWELANSSEWAAATGDIGVCQEQALIAALFDQYSQPWVREVVVRWASDFTELDLAVSQQLIAVAASLDAGSAGGKPLRAVSVCGVDTKFFERHRSLLTQLLDARFEGTVSEMGLEEFLDAEHEHEHWLLIAQLFDGPLIFPKIRVPATALLTTALPGTHVLIVENERSLHQIPRLENTMAILGAGRDLGWLRATWLSERRVGYWGDIDTWGLALLAEARRHRPKLTALLMNQQTYDGSRASAVPERRSFVTLVGTPHGLVEEERALFEFLASTPKGRLEQEFLPTSLVQQQLIHWHAVREVKSSLAITALQTS